MDGGREEGVEERQKGEGEWTEGERVRVERGGREGEGGGWREGEEKGRVEGGGREGEGGGWRKRVEGGGSEE